MKKLFFILMLMVSVVAVNAQVDTTHKAKPAMTIVKVTDLPKPVTTSIAKDYPGYTVKEASSAMTNNGLNYKVVVTKGTESESLIYDKDGKFVKKLPKK